MLTITLKYKTLEPLAQKIIFADFDWQLANYVKVHPYVLRFLHSGYKPEVLQYRLYVSFVSDNPMHPIRFLNDLDSILKRSDSFTLLDFLYDKHLHF